MNGFYLYTPVKEYFYISDKKNITDSIVKKFLEQIAIYKHIPAENIDHVVNDRNNIDYFKNRIEKMSLDKTEISYSIHNENASYCYPVNDFDVIVF